MGFKKLKSKTIAKADQRSNNLSVIDPTLDLGNGLTLAGYEAQITATRAKLDEYNGLLTQADVAKDEYQDLEKVLRDWSERMLSGVGSKYGKDAGEYEAAGGVRKSERKRRRRKPKPITPAVE